MSSQNPDKEECCPKCGNEMILKDNMFHWRGKWMSGLVCEKCNALYDNPKESFMEYAKNHSA